MQITKSLFVITIMLLIFTGCEAKIKNIKIEKYKVWGNCEMCKKTIETAVYIKNISDGLWNKDSKIVQLTFDSTLTNADEILKRIGKAGYDNEKYYAPDDVYASLETCCQYERRLKPLIAKVITKEDTVKVNQIKDENNLIDSKTVKIEKQEKSNELSKVFENYFAMKDALIRSDSKAVGLIAKNFIEIVNAVKMENLKQEEHIVWMKIQKSIIESAISIQKSSDILKQRNSFSLLSKSIYSLIKVTTQEKPIYLMHCPMFNDGKGSDWLSKENNIKNPYYGSQMLNCGSVKETIK